MKLALLTDNLLDRETVALDSLVLSTARAYFKID